MKSIIIILVFSFMAILNSCTTCNCEKQYQKLDSNSQMELSKLKSADDTVYVPVTALASQSLTNEQIIELKQMDVIEFQLIGKIITFRANYQTIEKINQLDYIKSIEINKISKTN